MYVELTNIQAFEKAEFELNDSGITVLVGHNSNGKSILITAINMLVTMAIKDSVDRATLIRDGCDTGWINMSDRGKYLLCQLGPDNVNTFMVYRRENGETIKRTLREGGWEELIYEFGWRVDKSTNSCLQIHMTYGVMPAVNTTPAHTYNIIKPWLVDSGAERFCNNYVSLMFPKLKATVSNYKSRVELLRQQKESISVKDTSTLLGIKDKMESYIAKTKGITRMQISLISIVPDVTLIDIQAPRLNKIKFVELLDEAPTIGSLADNIKEMTTIENGSCPMCGKALISGGTLP